MSQIEKKINQNLKLTSALKFAAKGIGVFELQSNSKDPLLGSSGFYDATTDPAVIAKFDPANNYGVRPGEHFVVVDLDVKDPTKDGNESLAKLLDVDVFELAALTFSACTPSGGRHLYFRSDQPFAERNGVLPGVDIKAVTGYVVGPGSTLPNGAYTIENEADFAQLPAKIAALLKAPRVRDPKADEPPPGGWDRPEYLEAARAFLAKREPAVEGDWGEPWTVETILFCRDFGVSADMCLQLMAIDTDWNQRCAPPWDFDELDRKIQSVFRYGDNRPGCKAPVMDLFFEMFPDEWTEMQDAGAALAQIAANDNRQPTDKTGADCTYRLSPHSSVIRPYSEWRKGIKPARMLIPEWLPDKGIGFVLAKRGTGKTQVMVSLAMAIATNTPFLGLRVTRDEMCSIYFVGEDEDGTASQMDAWIVRRNNGQTPPRFFAHGEVPNLCDPASIDYWCAQIRRSRGAIPALILFDTWQKGTAGVSQNDDDKMSAAMASAQRLADAANGFVLFAAHPPKGNTDSVMGSSRIENDCAAIWTFTPRDDKRSKCLEVTRLKRKGEGDYRVVVTDDVRLPGRDEWGNPNGGPLLRVVGGSEAKRINASYAETIAKLIFDEITRPWQDDRKPAQDAHPSISEIARRLAGREASFTDPATGEERMECLLGFERLKDQLAALFAQPVRVSTPGGDQMISIKDGKQNSKRFHIDPAREDDGYGIAPDVHDIPDSGDEA